MVSCDNLDDIGMVPYIRGFWLHFRGFLSIPYALAQNIFGPEIFHPSRPRCLKPVGGPRSQQTKLLTPAVGSPAT